VFFTGVGFGTTTYSLITCFVYGRRLQKGVQMVLAVNKFSSLFRASASGSGLAAGAGSAAGNANSLQVPQTRPRAESKDSDDD